MPSPELPPQWPQVAPNSTIFITIKTMETIIILTWRHHHQEPLQYRPCGPANSSGTNSKSDLAFLAAKWRRQVGSHRSHQRQGRHHHQIWFPPLYSLKGESLEEAPRRVASLRQQQNLIRSRYALSASVMLLVAITRCMTGCRHGASRLWKRPSCSRSRHLNRLSHSKVLRLSNSKDCLECNYQVVRLQVAITSTVRLSFTITMAVKAHQRSSKELGTKCWRSPDPALIILCDRVSETLQQRPVFSNRPQGSKTKAAKRSLKAR